jgi:hypothetical protein
MARIAAANCGSYSTPPAYRQLDDHTSAPATRRDPSTLNCLDRSFVRAEAALRIDLATALATSGNQDEASEHAGAPTR